MTGPEATHPTHPPLSQPLSPPLCRPLALALFQPEIAQNAGAACRTAACFGADLHIIEPCGFPLDAKGFRRTAMDYGLLAPPHVHAGWGAFTHSLSAPAAPRLILLTTKATVSLFDVAFRPGDILLLGQESAGAPEAVHARADIRARIPLAPAARSLNLAIAGAVALSEARRQIGYQ